MSIVPTPVLLVTGATGAGKTTYLSRLLAMRSGAARWAVLVNDFGAVRIDAAAGTGETHVYVREVAGCICCSAQVSLRTAIVSLLRQARPDRLLIEASAAAHPASIVKVLHQPGIAEVVALARTVCIVDPAQLLDPRYATAELYREQLSAADFVIFSKEDVISAEQRSAARRALTAFGVSVLEDSHDGEHASKLALWV
jgi:G3E family GTPase